jgi:hypothetical protein
VSCAATDIDLPPNALTYELLAGPNGMIVSSNGVVTWTPPADFPAGTNTFTVQVTDSSPEAVNEPHFSATNSYLALVPPPNRPPRLGPLPDLVVHAGDTVALRATATDPDGPTDALRFELEVFSWIPPDPTHATLDPISGEFSWPTTDADTGNIVLFAITVTDGGFPPLDSSRVFEVEVLAREDLMLSVSLATGQPTLSWNSAAGRQYQVQFKTGFSDQAWADVGPVLTGTGAQLEFTDSITNAAASRCYRLKEL